MSVEGKITSYLNCVTGSAGGWAGDKSAFPVLWHYG